MHWLTRHFAVSGLILPALYHTDLQNLRFHNELLLHNIHAFNRTWERTLFLADTCEYLKDDRLIQVSL